MITKKNFNKKKNLSEEYFYNCLLVNMLLKVGWFTVPHFWGKGIKYKKNSDCLGKNQSTTSLKQKMTK